MVEDMVLKSCPFGAFPVSAALITSHSTLEICILEGGLLVFGHTKSRVWV